MTRVPPLAATDRLFTHGYQIVPKFLEGSELRTLYNSSIKAFDDNQLISRISYASRGDYSIGCKNHIGTSDNRLWSLTRICLFSWNSLQDADLKLIERHSQAIHKYKVDHLSSLIGSKKYFNGLKSEDVYTSLSLYKANMGFISEHTDSRSGDLIIHAKLLIRKSEGPAKHSPHPWGGLFIHDKGCRSTSYPEYEAQNGDLVLFNGSFRHGIATSLNDRLALFPIPTVFIQPSILTACSGLGIPFHERVKSRLLTKLLSIM